MYVPTASVTSAHTVFPVVFPVPTDVLIWLPMDLNYLMEMFAPMGAVPWPKETFIYCSSVLKMGLLAYMEKNKMKKTGWGSDRLRNSLGRQKSK